MGTLHLADQTLLRELKELVAQDRLTTASLIAHIAEVDERKLYLPASYPSMYMYCVRELGMSEDTAFRRIHVARAARRFPMIFQALADGRLNLTSVLLLTPHLKPENAEGLLAAAAHKSKAEIELLLADRFPRPDVPTVVRAIAPVVAASELATRPVDPFATSLAPEQVDRAILSRAPVQIEPLSPRAKITPIAANKFAMQLTIDRETHDQLIYAQALLGHAVPSGDIAQVLKRAVDALVRELERKKFAKCARVHVARPKSRDKNSDDNCRHIPASIRREVWHRDGGQCTFVSASGRRCEERTRLEFDHTQPLARGGQTTTGQLLLKCRAHNQYAAECAYGPEFMRQKRYAAKQRAMRQRAANIGAHAHSSAEARDNSDCSTSSSATSHQDIIPWLRQLGFSVDEARRGAAQCAKLRDAPLEHRVRVALQNLAPRCGHRTAPSACGQA
jgi:hypothetical protein